MLWQKTQYRLTKSTKAIIIGLFLSHVLLININAAEWGDSYRILRAAEAIRHGTYPRDEKRPPVYPAILAFRPATLEPILWGRLVMLGVSMALFYVFWKYTGLVFSEVPLRNLALVLYAFNPIIFYWSLRLMSDVLFALLVLIELYLLKKVKVKPTNPQLAGLSLLSLVAVATRFEGYLLVLASISGLLFKELTLSSLKTLSQYTIQAWVKLLKPVTSYCLYFGLGLVPYLYYFNPLDSAYLKEPGTRIYNLDTVIIYILSLLFSMGGIYTMYFLVQQKSKVMTFLTSNPELLVFLCGYLALCLVWPAALPRLFVPVIFIFVLVTCLALASYFSYTPKQPLAAAFVAKLVHLITRSRTFLKKDLIFLLGLVLVYGFGQYIYKLQFLVLIKSVFGLILLLSVLQLLVIYLRSYRLYIYTSVVILISWSLATVWLHKDVFKVITQANIWAVQNLAGTVGYNDVSSVSDWYLNIAYSPDITGVFYDLTQKENKRYDTLAAKKIDFLLVTNEHNTQMTIDVSDKPWLRQIYSYEAIINGKLFFTKLFKFERSQP